VDRGRHLVAIVFTDLAGYTSLTQVDEAGALALLDRQERLVGPLLVEHRGRQVKSMGDGLLLEFPNARDAVEWSVTLQRRIHEQDNREGGRPLRMRVGIHLGDVQRRGPDILGDSVNIASRVEPLAEPGGVCLSSTVYEQVRNKVTIPLEKLGPRRLKGVHDLVDIYRVVFPWSGPASALAGPLLPRIAVLPLANISPDPNDEYFADGLTEELITVLSQIKGLRVISRTSTSQYKGTAKSITQIGAELGAESVLEGSVRKAGNQLRIAIQLIDARTDEHRWAQIYERKLDDVFAIQADVAERTAGALKVELLKSERAFVEEKPTSSIVAYELYLRGIRASRRCETPENEADDREAVRLFTEAIREDPRFSAAYSNLANHLILVMGWTRPAREVVPRARELAAKALELNPHSSDAHTALGNLAMQADLDWTRAEAEFQQAIVLNPSSSTARLWYGGLLLALLRVGEARKQLLTATQLDPLWLAPWQGLAWTYFLQGDLDTATDIYEQLWKDFHENKQVRWIRYFRALFYSVGKRTEDARRLIEPLATSPDLYSRMDRAELLAVLGEPDELRTIVREFEDGRYPVVRTEGALAMDYALLSEKDRALAIVERDYREGDKSFLWWYQDPLLDSIREDPRFVAVLRAMSLPVSLPRPLLGALIRSTNSPAGG
jgi:adenylate cyclase